MVLKERKMTKLLYLKASPRKVYSKSIEIADAYLDALRDQNPDLEVDTIELWDEDLPAFDGNKAAAKMNVLSGNDQDVVQQSAWDQVVEIAQRFISADRYLFAVPMWNSSIPYRLKQYIDLIHQPGLLWGLNPDTGYYGLLKDKHATLTLTSGVYGEHVATPAFGVDHHSTYLRDWLNQAGVTEIDMVRFQPSMVTEDPAGEFEKARERGVQLAKTHGQI
jgi:FMN-dependent NADH-azoreductase